jgi:hypothetical protein
MSKYVEMKEPLHSKNLLPFKDRRNGYHLPGGAIEEEEHFIDLVDPELSHEEQGFIRHYLAYADVFLQNARASAPSRNGETPTVASGQEDPEDKAA